MNAHTIELCVSSDIGVQLSVSDHLTYQPEYFNLGETYILHILKINVHI